MRNFIVSSALVGALACFGLAACTADVHDNTLDVHDNNANIDEAKVEMTTSSDVDNIQAGQSVHVDIAAQDVFLVDPASTPPPDRVKVAGHFEVFLDSTSGTALLVTAEKSFDVTIPAATSAGDHKLICRVDKHDGTATKATSELDLKVVATVTTK